MSFFIELKLTTLVDTLEASYGAELLVRNDDLPELTFSAEISLVPLRAAPPLADAPVFPGAAITSNNNTAAIAASISVIAVALIAVRENFPARPLSGVFLFPFVCC